MARGKKNEKEITIEERLEQALVPAEEQPYSVPENWCWTYIKSAYEVTSSKRVHKEDWLSEGIPFYRTRELVKLSNQGYVDNELFISDELYRTFKATYGVPQIGDLLISGVGTIGIPYIIESENPFYFKDGNVIWLKSKQLLNPKYTYYLYKSNYMDNMIHSMSSGTTVDTYTIVNANATPIPLPPSHEQQRIVDRIENLFAKLGEAKDKVQAVVDGFETRRATILHKAFTGELTKIWRAEHQYSIKEWAVKKIGDFSFVTKLAGFEYTNDIAPNLTDTGIPLFKGKNVQQGKLILEFESYIPKDVSDNLPRSKLAKKCLLTPYVGTIGNIALFDGSFEAHLGSNVGKIEVNSDTYEEYLLYYLRSDFGYKELTKHKKATAQESISIQAIRDVIVILPPLDEQQEIVRIIDTLFAKEQQAKEAAEAVLDQIEAMKKSILARAFRGELGTNDPREESAREMLKQVLLDDKNDGSASTAVQKRIVIPKNIGEKLSTGMERDVVKLLYTADKDDVALSEIMSLSSKKFDLLDTIRALENKNIIRKNGKGNYVLVNKR